MKSKVSRLGISILCVSAFFLSMTIPSISYAERTTANNDIPLIKAEHSEETGPDIKERTQSILHPEQKMEISTIPSDHAYIPENTILTVELVRDISSKHIKTGMPVPLILKENLIVNDIVAAPAGSEVYGVVTKATKSGFFGRSGKLEFQINYLNAVNGVHIPLQYITKKESGSDGGAVAVALLASPVGGFLMKGKNVTYKAGTLFDARVTADTDLETTLDDLAETMNPAKPHGTVITIKKQ